MNGRVIYATPDHPSPSGGVRTIYRHVELLARSGVDAAVWHRDPTFQIDWFDHSSKVIHGDTLKVEPTDLLVIPEVLVFPGVDPAPGARKVIFNQNYFYTFDHFPDGSPVTYPDWGPAPRIWTTSKESAELLGHILPSLKLSLIPYSVDSALFSPREAATGGSSRPRRIAWMPRKRPREAQLLEYLWRSDERLKDVELTAIDEMNESSVARILGETSVFVTLGEREGFGLPALEALAAGCLVVGFPAGGGAELFKAPGTFAVCDVDLQAVAATAARLVLSSNTENLRAKVREWAITHYGVERERDALLAAVAAASDIPASVPVTATHPLRFVGPVYGGNHLGAFDEQVNCGFPCAACIDQTKRLEAALNTSNAELDSTRRRLAVVGNELQDRRAEQAAWMATLKEMVLFEETKAQFTYNNREFQRLNEQKLIVEGRLRAMEGSTSWRVTAPLRRIALALRIQRRG